LACGFGAVESENDGVKLDGRGLCRGSLRRNIKASLTAIRSGILTARLLAIPRQPPPARTSGGRGEVRFSTTNQASLYRRAFAPSASRWFVSGSAGLQQRRLRRERHPEQPRILNPAGSPEAVIPEVKKPHDATTSPHCVTKGNQSGNALPTPDPLGRLNCK